MHTSPNAATEERDFALYMCTLSNLALCRGNASLFPGPVYFDVQGSVTYVYDSPKVGCALYVSRNFDGQFTQIDLPSVVEDCQVCVLS